MSAEKGPTGTSTPSSSNSRPSSSARRVRFVSSANHGVKLLASFGHVSRRSTLLSFPRSVPISRPPYHWPSWSNTRHVHLAILRLMHVRRAKGVEHLCHLTQSLSRRRSSISKLPCQHHHQ